MDLMSILENGVIPPQLFQVIEARFGYYNTAVNAMDLIAYIIYLQQRIAALETAANITPPAPPAGYQ